MHIKCRLPLFVLLASFLCCGVITKVFILFNLPSAPLPPSRKFDIRQWVLVTGEPLTAWFYGACYLRFCAEDWSLADLGAHAHLSNNCVACTSPLFGRCPAIGDVRPFRLLQMRLLMQPGLPRLAQEVASRKTLWQPVGGGCASQLMVTDTESVELMVSSVILSAKHARKGKYQVVLLACIVSAVSACHGVAQSMAAQGNMWTCGQFAGHLGREHGSAALWTQHIQPQMRAAVHHSLAAASVRPHADPWPSLFCSCKQPQERSLCHRAVFRRSSASCLRYLE